MKTLRQLSAATILCLTLAVSVFAGHIETPGVVSPPPATGTAMTNDPTTTTSDITTSVILAIVGLIN